MRTLRLLGKNDLKFIDVLDSNAQLLLDPFLVEIYISTIKKVKSMSDYLTNCAKK